MKTKLFTLLLAVAASVGTLFASNTQVNGIWYNFDSSSKTATVTYRGSSYSSYSNEYTGAVVIPASVTYNNVTYSVTSIGSWAFRECSGLTSVTIPNSVTSIGGSAFSGCSGLPVVDDLRYADTYLVEAVDKTLSSYIIKDGTKWIGDYAFGYCSGLTSVTIPNSVTSIGNYAFYYCTGLTSVTIPSSVTSIGSEAFWNCSGLTSVTIPSSVTSIGSGAFYYVPNIVYSGSATGSPWGARSVNGYVDGYWVYSDNTKTTLLACSSAAQGEIIIPNSVTSIGEYAFYGCSGLTSIEIPNSVTSIGSDAFSWCTGLTSVTIPNSVTSIGSKAFYQCRGLTSVTIPNSVTSIGNYAFSSCTGLTSVTIPNSVTSIGSSAFYGCTGLTSVTIPNSVTSIGSNAFYDCSSLCKITFGEGLTSIGNYALRGCSKLDTVVWNVKNYTILSSTNTPFYYYNSSSTSNNFDIRYQIKSFTFGPHVETIPAYLCSDMSQINSVIIPNSVTSIGEKAFYLCTSLKIVINNSALDIVKGSTNYGYVANYANDVYKGGDVIGDFVFSKKDETDYVVAYTGNDSQVTLPANYRGGSYGVAAYLFYNNTTVKSITLSNSVTSIGSNAFEGCTGLTSVTIPNSVTSIGANAFNGCSNLNVVYIGNSVISIGQSAFYNCPQLYKVIMLPNSVPSGINSAFSTLSGRVTYVGNTNYQSGYNVLGTQRIYPNLNSYFTVDGIVYALLNPSKRTCDIIDCDYSGATTEFTIGNTVVYRNVTLSVESINSNAFRNNREMTKLTVNNLADIGDYAFQNCSSLEDVTIQNKGNIGTQAFAGSSTQNPATYTISNVGSIGTSAFANCTAIKTLKIDSCVTTIGNNAFQNCYGLEEVTIQNKGNIGTQAFAGSSTQNPATYIVNNVGSVGNYAFANCTAIKSLTIDSCVTSIGNYAFQNCSSLEDVTIQNKGNIGTQAFKGSSTQNPATYIISNVGSIGESAFANCSKLRKARLGNQVSGINQSAFSGCVLLDSITMPNTISSLGASAFNNCQKLEYVKLSNQLTSIGQSAFAGCSLLPELFIPKSVISIGNSTFQQCTSLSIVSFEDSSAPLSLGTNASNQGLFYDCHLDSLYIGRELNYPKTASDGYSPFYRNSSLRSIVISDFPTKVETNEFYGCTKLYSVYIGNGVQRIGDYAFSGCSSIDYFSFGSQVQTIGAEAFSDCVAMTRLYSYCQVPPTCGASALEDIDKWNCTLFIPKGTTSTYSAANQWQDFFFVEENEEGGDGVKYPISVEYDATMGTVTGAGVYNRGAEAVLIATPAEGCVFVEWEDGSTDPERHIFVYQSATYTATFSAPKYELYNGTEAAVIGVSAAGGIAIDRATYPNAIAYSYFPTTDINLPVNICGQNNEGDWYADSIVLIDAQPFYAPYDVEAKQLSYTRTFATDQWQALYVPFDMQYSDFSSKARIAYVNNVHQYDDDDNGVIDRTVIEFISVVDDYLQANWPYIVKPQTAGEMAFNVANTTLHATEDSDVECQSAFTRFNVIGTYQNTPVAGKYVVDNSEFEFCESEQTVSPFRIYLVVANKYPSSPQPAPQRISFMIDGEEEPAPTGIDVLYEDEQTGALYDILGRPVSRPTQGIFIRNGEKVLVK